MNRKQVNNLHSSSKPSAASLPEELAATRIQAGFRGYMVRKEYPELHTTTSTHTRYVPNSKANKPIQSRLTDSHELTPTTAATRIQATFRGYHTRKHLADEPHHTTSYGPATSGRYSLQPDTAAAKIQAGFRGYRTRRELKEKNKYPITSASGTYANHFDNIHSDPNYAATRIQATFRGYQTRRALHGDSHGFDADTKVPLRTQNHSSQLRSPNQIDRHSTGYDWSGKDKTTKVQKYHTGRYSQYTPPDGTKFTSGQVNKENADLAATRIQAAYRGFATRKHLNQAVKQPADTNMNKTTGHNFRYTDPSEAATKIQATFRGYKTRRYLHNSPSSINTHHT